MSRSLEASVARRRVIVSVCATLLVFTGVGAFLALTNDRRPQPVATSTEPSNGPVIQFDVPPPTPSVTTEVVPIAKSSDPEAFATAVAEALFAWDTATMTSQVGYTERLVAVADPTGEESAGLVADIANYLPTPNAWASLREYRTRQWLDVISAEVPTLWPQALAEAGPDGLLPGTTAYTIEGTRHRAGIWEDDVVESMHQVAFTIFIVCAPSYPTCHVLRLSLPDQPLD